ncbi:MAG: hypothetical protein JNG88_00445 [Phycisphaerales bacterium]|nr:hypothetical protein [Phycisphaerales bacterium]
MKRILFTSSLFALFLCVPADARQQFLKNGSFDIPGPEATTLRWNAFGGAGQSTDYLFDGSFSALTSVRVNAFVGMYQDTYDAVAGNEVQMKAMAYVPADAAPTGNIVAGIKLEFFPPTGVETPPPEENLAFDADDPVDTWVPVTLITTVPPGIEIAKVVVISFDESTTNGNAYADLVSAELSSNPGLNLLQNPSFEIGGSGNDGMPNWDEFASPFSGARKNCFDVTAFDQDCTTKFIGQTAGLIQEIEVVPGDTLTITGYFFSRSAAPYADENARAGVKVEWVAGRLPEFQVDIVPNGNPASATTNIVNSGTPTNQWVPVTINYTMPAQTASRLRGTIINGFGPGTCDVYFDAFEMVIANVFDGSDVDADNDEDLLDIASLQTSFNGSNNPMKFLGLVYDHDEDGDVDSSDSNFTLDRMVGPALP